VEIQILAEGVHGADVVGLGPVGILAESALHNKPKRRDAVARAKQRCGLSDVGRKDVERCVSAHSHLDEIAFELLLHGRVSVWRDRISVSSATRLTPSTTWRPI